MDKKILISSILSIVLFSSIALAVQIGTYQVPINPMQPGNTPPTVWTIDKMLSVDGINPISRTGNYAFSGELFVYSVLVRDTNGASDILNAIITYNGLSSTPCTLVTNLNDVGGTANILAKTGQTYSSSTDKVFKCMLNTLSTWSGSGQIYVYSTDSANNVGQSPSDSWTFNPPFNVDISPSSGTSITFGPMNTTTRTSVSTNQLVITNNGVPSFLAFFAGSDFYASVTSSKCPTSNSLSISQFKYDVIRNSLDYGWTTIPKYNTNLDCVGVTCWGGNQIEGGAVNYGQSFNIGFSVTYPTPCIGTFDTGTFYVMVRSI
jgi:hypothetical protein